MDFGKVNASSLSTPESAMILDKDLYLTGDNKTIYLGGASGTSGEAIRGNTGYIEIKNADGDYSHLNTNYTAGMVTTPSTSVTSAGVLTVGAFTVNLHTDPYGTGIVETFSVSGGEVTITENVNNFVCANYNNGSPIVSVYTDENLVTGTTIMPFLNCYRVGEYTDILAWGEASKALSIKLSSRILRIYGIHRETGLALSNPSAKLIDISEGYVWFGSTRIHLNSFTTGSSGSTLREWVHDGSMNWTPTVVAGFDTANYQGANGKVDLSNSGFGCIWVYRKVATTESTGKEVAGYIFGTADYASLAAAESSDLPADLPPIFRSFGVLVGKICYGSDDATSLSVLSAYTEHFNMTNATNHNNLSGLQGGTSSEYYHTTLAENEQVQSLPYTAIYNQLYNTGFERWTRSGLTQGSASGRQTAFNVSNIFLDEDGTSYASWTGTVCNITDGGAYLLCTATDTSGTQVMTYELSGLTVGKRYKFAATVANGTGTLAYGCKMGVIQNGGTHIRSTRIEAAGTYSVLWEAVGTTDKIRFIFKMSNTQNMQVSNVYVDEVHHGCVDADTYAACDHSKTTTLDCFREWNEDSANTYGYGAYLLKLVKGTDTAEYYNFDRTNTGYRDLQGKRVAFGCYVYSVTATDNIKLSIYDGRTEIALSTSYCGADAITWMEVTGLVALNATEITCRILCDGDTNDVAYISHPVMMVGTKIGTGNYRKGSNLELPRALLSSLETQTTSNTSITYPVTFNSEPVKVGIVHSTTTESSKIKMTTAGTYLVTFTAVCDSTANAKRLNLWVALDGEDFPNSNTIVQMSNSSTETMIVMSFIYTCSENQYFEIMMYGDDAGNKLLYTAATSGPPPRPACPSILITINMI